MKRFRIRNSNSGAVLGVYTATEKRIALDAFARDVGYKNHAHAQAVALADSIVVDDVDSLETSWDRTEYLTGICD